MFIVGFDLGKRKFQLCILEENDRVAAELRIDTTTEALSKCFQRFSSARVLIEASTSSDWVSRYLESIGCEVVIGDPRFGPMYARADKKLKTDKRDAKALAEALRIGAFHAANRKSESSRKVRAAVLARHALVMSGTRLINQVRALCERVGCAPDCITHRAGPWHRHPHRADVQVCRRKPKQIRVCTTRGELPRPCSARAELGGEETPRRRHHQDRRHADPLILVADGREHHEEERAIFANEEVGAPYRRAARQTESCDRVGAQALSRALRPLARRHVVHAA